MPFKLGGSEEDLSQLSLEPLKPTVEPCSHQPYKKEHNESNGSVENSLTQADLKFAFFESEFRWVQMQQAEDTFRELDALLKDCCRKLCVVNKVDSRAHLVHAPPKTEKYTLLQRTGQDQLRVNIVLLAENVLQTDVSMKHSKVPGGVFRSTAQPDVQWKLQQLLDTANLCVRALGVVMQAFPRIIELRTKKAWSDDSGEYFIAVCTQIAEAIGSARSTLAMPRKRSLLEICHYPPTKCFNPPLPSDILFSYYILSSKLVCAAYNIAQRSNGGGQNLCISQADCQLPYLIDVLSNLDKAYKLNSVYVGNLKSLLKSKNSIYTGKK